MMPIRFLQETSAIASSVGRSFLHILPYLALSIPLAVLLKRSGAADRIRRGLGANPYMAVFMATAVGALSPFCSCGVVPIITALLVSGVPLAPVMSFWLASPSMDPEIFVLSVGSIGWELALWRLAATAVMSLGGGLVVLWLERRGWLGQDFLRPSVSGTSVGEPGPRLALATCCAGTAGPAFAFRETPGQDACGCVAKLSLEPEAPSHGGSCGCGEPVREGTCARKPSLLADTVRTTLSLSAYMVVAFLLEALILRYVPQELISARLGGESAWSVPLATLLSIPMYTTNLTSLGLVAGLLQRGMSGGAALAFLIGGAVTTLPAMAAVYGLVRWRVFALYLGFCVAGSLLTGFAYQLVQSLHP
jgi:uncharacterized protein